MTHRWRSLVWGCASTAAVLGLGVQAEPGDPATVRTPSVTVSAMTEILGRPTDRSVALSVLAPSALQAYTQFGTTPGRYTRRTTSRRSAPATPLVLTLAGLKPGTRYFYRLRYRAPGHAVFRTGAQHSFWTRRAPGSTFTFALQADSHPERVGKMFDPALYKQTMRNVARERPDFYLTLGDDFSLDPLIARGELTRRTTDQVYVNQRSYLGMVGASSPLFLVNGNHEDAAQVLLNGKATSPAVLAGTARTTFYPLPAPGRFYRGDTAKIAFVGFRRDYYAWTWGDALFVVIDPYWHSPVQVDSGPGAKGGGGGKKNRDMWGITIGNTQYQWLRKTLEQSTAKYKFVFTHHVLGTGRGGIEEAGLYEWGGTDPTGKATFAEKRPTWELPIQQLMARAGVTIFFQGHDHLFARQELAGVIYQETPNPADPTYTAFNSDAYSSGTILPNSGHLLVSVSPTRVKVSYISSYLPKDTTAERKNGATAYSYTVSPQG